ncbi:MAG TPA: SxtJ family membrane protein [Chthoniobacterales bacterium]|nr:SxtJ family membrane protein [Chthoniobacterales bacterium]
MSIRQQINDLKTATPDLRKFGLLVGGVLCLVGFLLLLRHKTNYPYLFWPGAVLIGFGAVWPRALKYPYITWMTMAFALGFVMSQVILTLFFFLLVTPISLVARFVGKDFLSRKWDKQATSYWLPRKAEAKKPDSYQQQY